jgi:hypothetical protein
MDSRTQRLTPRTLRIVTLLGEHETFEKVKQVDATITDQDIRKAHAEVLGVLGIGEPVTRQMLDRMLASANRDLKPRARSRKAIDAAYQLKITLRGSKPPIWRRFVVPGTIRLNELHQVIQAVMGWYDCHLHCFEIDAEQYVAHHPDFDSDGLNEREHRLCDLITEPKTRFTYEYDFGDGWEHTLTVEKIIPNTENPQMMVCLAGRGRCPLEDCGGIWGWHRLLGVLNNPKHEEHDDMLEWAGGMIDPTEFDPQAATAALSAIKLRKR